MIFATLDEGGRDGTLLVVDRARQRAVRAVSVTPTLQSLLDNWDSHLEAVRALSRQLESGECREVVPLTDARLTAPLPRSYQFLDGSVYPEHMSVIRQARGAKMPDDFFDKPLLYQGLSDKIIGPNEAVRLTDDKSFGVDIEAEIVVITGDVPQAVTVDRASAHVRLLGLLNDISLRGIIPPELARGFGFIQGKSASSMGPFVVTPDEVGELWNGQLLSGRYLCHVRGQLLGELDPGIDAAFSYPQLIAHAARTRALSAGTVLGAGALANKDRWRGCGCIAELRAREQLTSGEARTPYLRFGDEMRLEMFDRNGNSIFGAIEQRLERWETR